MAGVKVDPPPLAIQIVDLKTGMPTRAMSDFLLRLWQRTGGNVDAVEGLVQVNIDNQDMHFGYVVPNYTQQAREDAESMAVVMAQMNRPHASEETESLAAMAVIMAEMSRAHASELAELRKEIEAAKAMIVSMAFTGTRSYSGI